MIYRVGDRVEWFNHDIGGWLNRGEKYTGEILDSEYHPKYGAVYMIQCDNCVRVKNIPEDWILNKERTFIQDYDRAMKGI